MPRIAGVHRFEEGALLELWPCSESQIFSVFEGAPSQFGDFALLHIRNSEHIKGLEAGDEATLEQYIKESPRDSGRSFVGGRALRSAGIMLVKGTFDNVQSSELCDALQEEHLK